MRPAGRSWREAIPGAAVEVWKTAMPVRPVALACLRCRLIWTKRKAPGCSGVPCPICAQAAERLPGQGGLQGMAPSCPAAPHRQDMAPLSLRLPDPSGGSGRSGRRRPSCVPCPMPSRMPCRRRQAGVGQDDVARCRKVPQVPSSCCMKPRAPDLAGWPCDLGLDAGAGVPPCSRGAWRRGRQLCLPSGKGTAPKRRRSAFHALSFGLALSKDAGRGRPASLAKTCGSRLRPVLTACGVASLPAPVRRAGPVALEHRWGAGARSQAQSWQAAPEAGPLPGGWSGLPAAYRRAPATAWLGASRMSGVFCVPSCSGIAGPAPGAFWAGALSGLRTRQTGQDCLSAVRLGQDLPRRTGACRQRLPGVRLRKCICPAGQEARPGASFKLLGASPARCGLRELLAVSPVRSARWSADTWRAPGKAKAGWQLGVWAAGARRWRHDATSGESPKRWRSAGHDRSSDRVGQQTISSASEPGEAVAVTHGARKACQPVAGTGGDGVTAGISAPAFRSFFSKEIVKTTGCCKECGRVLPSKRASIMRLEQVIRFNLYQEKYIKEVRRNVDVV